MEYTKWLSRSLIVLTISGLLVLLYIGKVGEEKPGNSTVTESKEIEPSQVPSPSPSWTNFPKILCVDKLPNVDDTWPVDSAMQMWNERPTGLLFGTGPDCRSVILLRYEEIEGGAWGFTEFDRGGYGAHVTLSPIVPIQHRQHVLCHELGHVLGLSHPKHPDSCMNIDLTIDHPSTEDLSKAGLNLWQYPTKL